MLALGDATAVGGSTIDSRFGVIVGGEGSFATLQHQLDVLGSTWWLSFTPSQYTIPGHRQAILLNTKLDPNGAPVLMDSEQLQSLVRANPASAWLIGNEPNVPGQDDITPAAYAGFLQRYTATIKAVDPAALIVAPNVLNLTSTCTGCDGFTRGDTWILQLMDSYLTAYQQSPPIDVWGMHTYDIDWNDLPMTNTAVPEAELIAFRPFVDNLDGQHGKPIWLTEFGVIWGCDGLFSGPSGLLACPPGHYLQVALDEYLSTMAAFIVDEGPGLNLQAAFPYISFATPEPYADVATGIQLFDGPDASSMLTTAGEIWQSYAEGSRGEACTCTQPYN